MHHQKMVILGLVGIGKKYGFEIEAFIADAEMKRWAEIGNSTIYKVLKDLEKDGCLTGRKIKGGKGPAKTEYALTAQGQQQLTAYILEALKSDKTTRLDRISGLFFAPLLSRSTGSAALEQTMGHLHDAQDELRGHLSARPDDVIAEAIIQFYIDVFEAEARAIKKVYRLFA